MKEVFMKKAISTIVSALAVSTSGSAFPQMMYTSVMGNAVAFMNGTFEQKMCTGTGGILEYIVSNAINKPVGCKCPTGTQFYAPSGGCVKPAAGTMQQTN